MGTTFFKSVYKWIGNLALNFVVRSITGKSIEPNEVPIDGIPVSGKGGVNVAAIASAVGAALVTAKPQIITKPIGRIFDTCKHLVRNDKSLKNEELAIIAMTVRERMYAILYRSCQDNPLLTLFFMAFVLWVGGKPILKIINKKKSMENDTTDVSSVYDQMSESEIRDMLKFTNGDFGSNKLISPTQVVKGFNGKSRRSDSIRSDKRRRQIHLLRQQELIRRLLEEENNG